MPDPGFTPSVQAAPAPGLGGATTDMGDLDSWMNFGQTASFGVTSSQDILPNCHMPIQDELSLDLDAEAWAHLAGLI